MEKPAPEVAPMHSPQAVQAEAQKPMRIEGADRAEQPM